MCSIGEHIGEQCGVDLQYKSDFTDVEWKLLKLRSGRSTLKGVCKHHKLSYLTLYEKRQLVCCNPLNKHKSGSALPYKAISVSLYRKAKGTISLTPGKKVCKSCHQHLHVLFGEEEELESSQSLEATPENSEQLDIGPNAAPTENLTLNPVEELMQDIPDIPVELPEDSQLASVSRLRPRPPATSKESSSPSSTKTDRPGPPSTTSSPGYIPPTDQSSKINKLNELLSNIGVSAVDRRKLKVNLNYGSQKLEEILNVVSALLQDNSGTNQVKLPVSDELAGFHALIDLLKEKFRTAKDSSEKVVILSVLPPTWSISKIEEEFGPLGASNYMIRKMKDHVKKYGILETPNPRPGRPISEETVKLVQEFYQLDEISSKEMPGCKDYKSVRENGVRIQKQRRMLLSNLESLYEHFIEDHGDTNPIGFSKFAELRPKHCVFAGAAGTHTVCVCIYHENVNLMFEDSRLKEATACDQVPIISFKDCLKQLICDNPKSECYFRECKSCPSPNILRERIEYALVEENFVESVTYRGWFKVGGRYHLEKVVKQIEDFLDIFMQSLETLLPHHFLTKKQSEKYQKIKENLKEGEALIICDFAENYSCIIQNATQGYHWTNDQVTIHPFVAYYRSASGNLEKVSYVAISDYMKHTTGSFHAFQEKFVPFLNKHLQEKNIKCEKMTYFSDGCSAQYKNRKNARNIANFEENFNGIKIEWHFFASCHGKGPCDGVGGTLKRCAKRASLQQTLIRNGTEMFEWAKEKLPNIHVEYFSNEEVALVVQEQEEFSKNVVKLTGIKSCHAIIPQSQTVIVMKRYSDSNVSKTYNLFKTRVLVPWDTLKDYILAVKGEHWCLANIVEKNYETKEMSVMFLTPPGRSRAYKFPDQDDICNIPWRDVLVGTTPTIRNVHTVPAADKTRADRELKLYQELGGDVCVLPEADIDEEYDPDDPLCE